MLGISRKFCKIRLRLTKMHVILKRDVEKYTSYGARKSLLSLPNEGLLMSCQSLGGSDKFGCPSPKQSGVIPRFSTYLSRGIRHSGNSQALNKLVAATGLRARVVVVKEDRGLQSWGV